MTLDLLGDAATPLLVLAWRPHGCSMTLDCSLWLGGGRRYSFTGASQIVMSATVNGRSFVDGESVQFHATGGWDYWGQVRRRPPLQPPLALVGFVSELRGSRSTR